LSPHRVPNFDEVVGGDLSESERERLLRVHNLLVQAGPPHELSPELDQVPWPEEALAPLGLVRRSPQRRRPRMVIASAAAALLLVGVLIGHSTGSRSAASFQSVYTVKMHGVATAPGAFASVEIGERGADGNWPMLVTVDNLPSLARGGYYDLWLSRNGQPVALCGSFNTKPGGSETVVRMTAAYTLSRKYGWIVTRHIAGAPDRSRQLVLST
jgi:hypothetical protein